MSNWRVEGTGYAGRSREASTNGRRLTLSGCVLRLSGPSAALVSALKDAFVPFEEAGASRRARRLGRAAETDESTFNFTVSHADGDQVPVQLREAETFLTAHFAELAKLRSRNGVTNVPLDFAWSVPSDALGQLNRSPRRCSRSAPS